MNTKNTLFYASVLIVLLVSGCTSSISSVEYEWAVGVCKNNAGVKFVEKPVDFYPTAKCKNGAVFNSDDGDFVNN